MWRADSRAYQWVRENPLAFVILVAVAVRIPAILWSKGFIHSDDHYDTVMIAYDWLINGFWGENGFLRWRGQPSETIGRFPLYNLSLWAVMASLKSIGVHSLDSMMYVVRSLHSLLSLAPVLAAFKIVQWTSKSWKWAVLAGLMAALNFGMPFLGVRNLIEVVGGNVWILALLAAYKWKDSPHWKWLFLAGVLSGLAWMIRFQVAFAVMAVPVVLWFDSKSFRPAVQFSLGVALMLLLSGVADLLLLGRFAGSTITNITMNFGLPPLYKTIPLLYPALLLLFLVLPFSPVLGKVMFRRSLIRNHRLLWFTSMFFVLSHSLMANQQERFVFPIVPAFLVLAALALWHKYQDDGYILKSRPLLRGLVSVTLAFNLALLAFFTPAYGHRGLIEPILSVRDVDPDADVLFIQPGLRKYIPMAYAGEKMHRFYVRQWSDLQRVRESSADAFEFVVLYPPEASRLSEFMDSASSVVGPLNPEFEVTPSSYDWLLNALNGKHNPDYAAYVYRPQGLADNKEAAPKSLTPLQ